MANSTDTSKLGAATQQPAKGSPASAAKPSTTNAKTKPAAAVAAEHAGHTAAEHEKMKG